MQCVVDDRSLGLPLNERVLLIHLDGYALGVGRELSSLGFVVNEFQCDGADRSSQWSALPADLVVFFSHQLSNELLAVVAELQSLRALPSVWFCERGEHSFLEAVLTSGVSSVILNDLQVKRFPDIFALAKARFHQQQLLADELRKTQTKLAERKVVEKAKGMLMEKNAWTEEQAFHRLRKMAMDKGISMSNVAQSIIEVLSLSDA